MYKWHMHANRVGGARQAVKEMEMGLKRPFISPPARRVSGPSQACMQYYRSLKTQIFSYKISCDLGNRRNR